MKNIISINFFWLVCITAFSQAQMLNKGQQIVFSKEDVINLSIYDWPETLVSYPVIFSDEIHSEDELEFIETKTGQPINYQLSDRIEKNGKLYSANINFLAVLPSGGSYSYTLKTGSRKAPIINNPIQITKGEKTWKIGNDEFNIDIPGSATFNTNNAPAPIISVYRNQQGLGNNTLYSKSNKVTSVITSIKESGELFAICEVRYLLENKGEYIANIKIVHGYPFVILDEEIKDIKKEDEVYLEMKWENFNPAYRFAGPWDRTPNLQADKYRIDKPVYTNYSQEDPYWTGMGWIEEPDKRMIYRLLPFAGNSAREQQPTMTFWEKGENACELGVFIYDHNRWNDKNYGIWQPTADLSVYFRYTDKVLYFTYPIQSGSRSTAIAYYPYKEGREKVKTFEKKIDEIAAKGGKDRSEMMYFRYTQMLHRQYALLGLNKVKDWVLKYPENAKHPENPFEDREQMPSPDKFYNQIITSPMAYYPTGLNTFPGIHSIQHRQMYSTWIHDYLRNYDKLNEKQRSTVDALFLISGYVNTLEAMNSIRHSIAGTANMAADGWSVPMQISFLFPEHPMAKEWADFFEKTIELYGLFYTRPTVNTYESKGGRWVESLGIYNWAYLRPTGHSNIASILYDKKNRFADIYMAQRGRWLLDMMTAPVWKNNNPSEEKVRGYPPHGAHGGGRLVPLYAPVYQLGNWLQNYDPILSENLRWTGEMGKEENDNPRMTDWKKVHAMEYDITDKGTNPHLKSSKYTGHGIVLRSGVDTSDELSIHLNQVDKGPNYRWGNQAQGNSGGIYFYAGGKIYTAHENESAGDHTQNNLDNVTNFGVMKDGAFLTIGMNELTSPMYDLDIAQFAELMSVDNGDKYSWPEYLSRSIMLIGSDYFLIYDQTGTNWRAANRFSWFTAKQDDFPKIIFLSGTARADHWTTAQTNNSKGFYRDATGSLLTLVAPKNKNIQVLNGKLTVPKLLEKEDISEFRPAQKTAKEGVVHISTDKSDDIVFRNGEEIHYSTTATSFIGEAGMVRRMKNGDLHLAIFKGKVIQADKLKIELDSKNEVAIALTHFKDGTCRGKFKNTGSAILKLSGVDAKGILYIDGVRHDRELSSITLPKGDHLIEYTTGDAMPLTSQITDAEYGHKDIKLFLDIASSAKEVRLELSSDGGKTWQNVGKTKNPVYVLPKPKPGKYHVRAISLNGKSEAGFAQEYPVYSNTEKPHYPEGLRTHLEKDKVNLSWGKVLGTEVYRLYRRKKGDDTFRKIYEGKSSKYTDNTANGVIPAKALPGALDNKEKEPSGIIIYEYAVTAVNGNGESEKSHIVDTNPVSWANWYPDTKLKFKRQSSFWLEPYVYPNRIPDRYYPD